MSEATKNQGFLKEFNKWYDNIEQKYPKYQDKDGYNIGNIRALKVGWKAALEYACKTMLSYPVCGHRSSHDRTNMIKLLKKELKG